MTFNPEHVAVLEKMLGNVPGAKAGVMFGSPAYKVNGKLAASIFGTAGIVAKVGPERVKELVGKPGIEPFEPMPKRVWKDWVLLTGHFEENRALFEEAVEYVMSETK